MCYITFNFDIQLVVELTADIVSTNSLLILEKWKNIIIIKQIIVGGIDMFDMTNVGEKISVIRRSKNMTQVELADKINVSFQAVSNWERGISMPDISNLCELALALDISIDELVDKSSSTIDSSIVNKLEEYVRANKDVDEDMADIVNFLNSDKEIFDIHKIEPILPFLGKDICNGIFNNYMSRKDYKQAEIVAPFVDKSIINQSVAKRMNEDCEVSGLVAFMDYDERDSMILEIYEKRGILSIKNYLPYASKALIEKIALIDYQKNKFQNFEYVAPFMEKKLLIKIMKNEIENAE